MKNLVEHIMYAPPEVPGLLEQVDLLRLAAGRKVDAGQKAELGQFFTPAPLAHFMASMLEFPGDVVHILDAGAGVGSLFAACVAELCQRKRHPKEIRVTAYEIDASLAEYLQETCELCRKSCNQVGITFTCEIIFADFIRSATEQLQGSLFAEPTRPGYTCAILNPPHRKIHAASEARMLLRQIGIETSNLYTGFQAAAIKLLEPGGELLTITPRSFCNGLYFKRFRKLLLQTMALRRLHLFESRQEVFKDDAVLQEHLILYAVKEARHPDSVVMSASSGFEDEMVLSRQVGYAQVVNPEDPEVFIHITPDSWSQQVSESMTAFHSSLEELGISVSTGRVVDFRARAFLRQQPEPGTTPLIYPTHFDDGMITWPKAKTKKPNALVIAEQTQPLLVPNDYYVLVRRFSAKEEKRRIVAVIYDPTRVPGEFVGFENHLNYFHCNGQGLPLPLAKGLAAFLNSTLVDAYFRQFSGHTQVNATDLRSLKYPTLAQLERLGAALPDRFLEQQELDRFIKEEWFDVSDAAGADPIRVKQRIDEALEVLKALGLPREQQNERSALTLLALLDLKPEMPWSEASGPLCGVHKMLRFFSTFYGKDYAENTRETVRRQTIHQFRDAGLIVANPDDLKRPTNSPATVYQIEQGALELLRTFGTDAWEEHLEVYLASVKTLKQRYAQEREMARIPLEVAPGKQITLSPGGQNILIEQIVQEFAPRFTPGATLLYVGDTDKKFAYIDEERLAALGISIEAHGKMPDVIIYHAAKNWLVLVEAVTSHGPIDPKRKGELEILFREAKAGVVFVTAFLSREALAGYLKNLAWETEVWIAESPAHLIHFDGERFLDPH